MEKKEKVGLLEREAKLYQGFKNAGGEKGIVSEPYAAAKKILGYNMDAKTWQKFIEMGLITENVDDGITVNNIEYEIIPNRIKKSPVEKEDVNLEKIIPQEGWFQIRSKSQIQEMLTIVSSNIAQIEAQMLEIDKKIEVLQEELKSGKQLLVGFKTERENLEFAVKYYEAVMKIACVVDGGENEKC